MSESPRLRIEGYVIVSADGMLADAARAMPAELKFPADQAFFAAALDAAAVVVHGRNSFEDQPRSAQRTRIVVTRRVAALAGDPANPKATLWNPAGTSFAEACRRAGVTAGVAAIIGGPEVFDLFMDAYDTFWLSQAHRLTLQGGTGAFPGVPPLSPQNVLARHGLVAAETRVLDAAQAVDVTAWRRD
jgi:dihydrofolate reductase